jgi:membrane protein implicated in regulation of membrane protease activity
VFIEAFSNAARGAGRSWQPMAIILSVMCGLRLVVLFVFVGVIGGVVAIAAVYPVTWAVAAILLAIYYFASRCIEKSGFDEQEQEAQAEELAEMKLDSLSVPPEKEWAEVKDELLEET